MASGLWWVKICLISISLRIGEKITGNINDHGARVEPKQNPAMMQAVGSWSCHFL